MDIIVNKSLNLETARWCPKWSNFDHKNTAAFVCVRHSFDAGRARFHRFWRGIARAIRTRLAHRGSRLSNVCWLGAVVALSGAEYRLLRVLLDHPQRILTRDQLLQLTQGRDADVFDRSIDLLVSRVRQRLGDGVRGSRYIKTVRNEGYVFCADVNAVSAPQGAAP